MVNDNSYHVLQKGGALNAALHRCNVNTAMRMVDSTATRKRRKRKELGDAPARHSVVHWQDTILDALFLDKLYDDGAILKLLLLFLENF